MPGQADGSIYIDTELDPQGFKAGSDRMKNAVKSLESQVKRLGPVLKQAIKGGDFSQYRQSAAEAEQEIQRLKEQMAELGRKPIATEQYERLVHSMDEAAAKVNVLTQRQREMRNAGVDESSKRWITLQQQIDQAQKAVDQYSAAIQRLENRGEAFVPGSVSAEYAALAARVKELEEKLEEANAQADRMERTAPRIGAAFKKVARTIRSGVIGALRTALSVTKTLAVGNQDYKKSFGGLISSAKKFALSMLGARGVYALLRKAVSAYMEENQELSNTLSACWSGIGNLLGPIITRLITLVAQAVAYVTSFLKLFGVFGKSTTKAIGKAGSAAAKETKALKRQLASFDELNILSGGDSGSGGGGGGASDAIGSLPDVTLPDWAKLMVEQLKAGNWGAAALTLASQINGMIKSVDWPGVGKKIGYYFNGALTFLATALLAVKWASLGSNLATGLNQVITGVDWKNLGTLLMARWIIIINGLGGFFKTLNWTGLGKALADCFTGIWGAIDWAQAARTISDGVKGALTGISSAIRNVNWMKLGSQIWDSLVAIVKNIDWLGLVTRAFNLLGAVIGGSSALIAGFATKFWKGLKAGFEATKAYFDAYIKAAGGNVIRGLWNGIVDALKNVGSWIVQNIWNPFINGFKSAFGIHSPSTKMAEQGKYIVQGLFLGIKNAWGSIVSFFRTALSSIVSTVKATWASVKADTSAAWSTVKSTIAGAWNAIKTMASSYGTSIISTTANAFDRIKGHISEKLNAARAAASTAWNNMKTTASSVVSGMSSTVSSYFSSIYNSISGKVSAVKNAVSSGFDGARSSIVSKMQSALNTIRNQGWYSVGSNICYGIANGIDSGWSWLKDKVWSLANSLLGAAKRALGIHSPSTVFRDVVGLNIGYGIGEGVEESTPSILNTVSGVADAIAKEMNAGDYAIKEIVPTATVDGAITNFTDTIADSFTSMLDRLQAIAERVTFKAPAISGSIVPYKIAASAYGGGSADVGSVIEASNDELGSVVTQVVMNATNTMTNAIVAAIRAYSGARVNIDSTAVGDMAIREINRRVRMSGQSPLVI